MIDEIEMGEMYRTLEFKDPSNSLVRLVIFDKYGFSYGEEFKKQYSSFEDYHKALENAAKD